MWTCNTSTLISATNKMQQILFYWFFSACSTRFGRQFSPSSGALWSIYSFSEQCIDSAVCCRPVTQVGWNSIQPVSPVEFHPTCVTGRQQTAESVHCSEKLYIGQIAPEDGKNCRPKRAEQAEKNQENKFYCILSVADTIQNLHSCE